MKIKIGITDDQQLFLKSLTALVNTFTSFEVIVDALNGEDLIEKLGTLDELPDIILVDVNMPVMDGAETVRYVSANYPLIKLVALSVKDDDLTIINMIKAGGCAYLLKDIHPNELERALLEIQEKGIYNGDAFNINYRRILIAQQQMKDGLRVTDKEKDFLQLACSDLTYKQIAAKMKLSERTIDGYRESLFMKLNVQSRVGMVMEAIRKNYIAI
ncbi:response regulator transcription factor [Chitinophaga pinensis]|nr:response regulator transcription factor [Chitinophaga pinensis]